MDYAIATGDTGPFMAIRDPECGTCSRLKDDVDQIYTKGGHAEGGHHRVVEVVTVPLSDAGSALPTVTVITEAGTTVFADGRREESSERTRTYSVAVYFEDGKWRFFDAGGTE